MNASGVPIGTSEQGNGMALQKSFLTGILFAAAFALPAQATQHANVDQFLDRLAAGSKQALDERTAKIAQLENQLKAPKSMSLACEFVEKARQRQFQIHIFNIAEPDEDMGTSLVWTAKAKFQGLLPPGLGAMEDVSYGGPPDDIGVYFQSSALRLERVSWGWAAQYKAGLIKCVIQSGAEFVY